MKNDRKQYQPRSCPYQSIYTKFVENLSFFFSEDMSRNENLTSMKVQNSFTKLQKMTGNNPNLDLVNINAIYKVLVIFLTICSQDIERKRNSDNQRP